MSKALAECIERFRSLESMAQIVPVLSDQEAIRLLGAFRQFPYIRWKKPRSRKPADVRLLWDWLWSGAELDVAELAKRAGVSEHVAEARLIVLAGARLIYPDGSISEPAERMLVSYLHRFGMKTAEPEKEKPKKRAAKKRPA